MPIFPNKPIPIRLRQTRKHREVRKTPRNRGESLGSQKNNVASILFREEGSWKKSLNNGKNPKSLTTDICRSSHATTQSCYEGRCVALFLSHRVSRRSPFTYMVQPLLWFGKKKCHSRALRNHQGCNKPRRDEAFAWIVRRRTPLQLLMCLGSWDAEILLHGLDTVEKDCLKNTWIGVLMMGNKMQRNGNKRLGQGG